MSHTHTDSDEVGTSSLTPAGSQDTQPSSHSKHCAQDQQVSISISLFPVLAVNCLQQGEVTMTARCSVRETMMWPVTFTNAG